MVTAVHVISNLFRIGGTEDHPGRHVARCRCGWESPKMDARASAKLAWYHHWKDSRATVPDQAKGVVKRA